MSPVSRALPAGPAPGAPVWVGAGRGRRQLPRAPGPLSSAWPGPLRPPPSRLASGADSEDAAGSLSGGADPRNGWCDVSERLAEERPAGCGATPVKAVRAERRRDERGGAARLSSADRGVPCGLCCEGAFPYCCVSPEGRDASLVAVNSAWFVLLQQEAW